jgi:hypothetical protein
LRTIVSMILILALTATAGRPQAPDARAARLREMQAIADGITVEETARGGRARLERLAEPVYRFDVADRNVTDGTVWIWGRSGRPSAVMTVTKHRAARQGPHWLTELTSLAPGPITGTVEGIGTWQPSRPGIVLRTFPKAPPPAEDAARRLRQMKDLVRQVGARENSRPREGQPAKRAAYFELRVLPQPVHRYADAQSGLIDGGLFLIAYGLNPEAIMLVEARREGPSGPEWQCGFARVSNMELQVDFEGKEIWSYRGPSSSGPRDTYWLFTRPIVDE